MPREGRTTSGGILQERACRSIFWVMLGGFVVFFGWLAETYDHDREKISDWLITVSDSS